MAVWVATPVDAPLPRIHKSEWNLTEKDGQPVTPERTLELGQNYPDFDLLCVVEMPPDGEVDLVFRRVEHWGDVQLPIFHSRFSVLRMSSRNRGPGMLTREQALFGSDVSGIKVSPGIPGASLHLECRGRRARANVNGIDTGWVDTTDDFGSIAFISREGRAVIKDLKVIPWPTHPMALTDRLSWGAGLGLAVGLLLALVGSGVVSAVVAAVCVVAGGWLFHVSVLDHMLPAVAPSLRTVLCGSLCLAPVAAVLAVDKWRWVVRIVLAVAVGLPAATVLLEAAARHDAPIYRQLEDPRLDLYFGPESATAPFDALTRMLSCEYIKHTLLPKRYDVLLLGGSRLFDRDEPDAFEKNVDVQLSTALSKLLSLPRGKRAEVAAIPTQLANPYQQFLLLENYYKDYNPKVVVLGVSRDQLDLFGPLKPRQVEELVEQSATPSWSTLLELNSPRKGVLQDAVLLPDDLAATLVDTRRLCEAIGSRLVLVVDARLPDAFKQVMQKFGETNEVPVVEGFDTDNGKYPIDILAGKVLTELLR